MNKPSIIKFTTPPPTQNGSAEQALERIDILKKDLAYILARLEEKINNLEN